MLRKLCPLLLLIPCLSFGILQTELPVRSVSAPLYPEVRNQPETHLRSTKPLEHVDFVVVSTFLIGWPPEAWLETRVYDYSRSTDQEIVFVLKSELFAGFALEHHLAIVWAQRQYGSIFPYYP